MNTLVRSGDIAIRLLRDEDQDYRLIARWLSDERVLQFYEGRDKPSDIDGVIEKFGPRAMGVDYVVPCLMIYQDNPIGYIQYYNLQEPEGREYGLETIESVFGVDLFIGEPNLWGQGIGTRVLTALVAYLFDNLEARKVTIDPQVSNLRAIRAYEKCGFQKIKVLPNHEIHEGEHRDNWLMAIDREEHLSRIDSLQAECGRS